MADKNKIAIIYNKFCPYAQRALIAALQKQVPVEFLKTGLGEETKTLFFQQSYSKALGRDPKSRGKVPVLIHNDKIIAESELICWYLAESFPTGSQLIPQDNLLRTKMRVWINQINVHLISIFDRAKFRQVLSIQDFLKQIGEFLDKVQKNIAGGYLLGNEISLADVMIYPWFQRWVIIEHFFDYPLQEKYTKIHNWLGNMNQRKSIFETKKLTNNQYYIERTKKMIPRL